MNTLVTHVHLKPGAGRDWDAVMHRRLTAARKRSGWVGRQPRRPVDQEDRRVVVGTWKTHADWEDSSGLTSLDRKRAVVRW